MIEYREFLPARELLAHVRCYWRSRGCADAVVQYNRVLPDGCIDLIFGLGSASVRPDGTRMFTGAFIVGPMQTAEVFAHTGEVDVLGVRFRPGAAPLFLGLPAVELRDQLVQANDVWPAAAALVDALGEAHGDAERVRWLDTLLCARLPDLPKWSDGVVAASAAIERSHGRVRIDALSSGLGWSTRLLQRAFLDWVGLTPKQAARVARLQHAVVLMLKPGASLAQVAIAAGYFDQAHFTREFKELAGITPTRYLAERSVAFVQDADSAG